jgi:hypothetical protein
VAPDLRLFVLSQVRGELTGAWSEGLGSAVRSCRSRQELSVFGWPGLKVTCQRLMTRGRVRSVLRESRGAEGLHPLDNSLTTAAGRGRGWTEGLRGPPPLLLHLVVC